MRLPHIVLASASVLTLAACSGAASTPDAEPSDFDVTLTSVVEAADLPWGMAFLPNGDLLFTEQVGGLKIARGGAGTPETVDGIPAAYTERQAGYLGLTLDPAFDDNRLVYVAYSKGTDDDNATAVIRARLSDDAATLEDVTEIFLADRRNTAFHYGARLQFLGDATLAIGLGDGFRYMDDAQNSTNTHGKLVRINSDGTMPADNPFAGSDDGHDAVWSYGHRNIQGLYYDAELDRLYATEHGPKGGDELNLIEPGTNYGWPVISYGVNYDGTIITNETEADGMQQPLSYWVPSIATSGLTKLTSDVYPGWQGDLFSGGMNGPAGLVLVRIDMEDGEVVGREDLLKDEIPVRDVIQGPDGHLYVASKDTGIYRVDLVEAAAEAP